MRKTAHMFTNRIQNKPNFTLTFEWVLSLLNTWLQFVGHFQYLKNIITHFRRFTNRFWVELREFLFSCNMHSLHYLRFVHNASAYSQATVSNGESRNFDKRAKNEESAIWLNHRPHSVLAGLNSRRRCIKHQNICLQLKSSQTQISLPGQSILPIYFIRFVYLSSDTLSIEGIQNDLV